VAFIGWRLIPARPDTISLEGDAGLYVAEARVKEGSKSIGQTVGELYPLADDSDVSILGCARRASGCRASPAGPRDPRRRFPGAGGDPKQIEAFMGAAELDVIGTEEHGGLMGKS
jgi:hypothetical protein